MRAAASCSIGSAPTTARRSGELCERLDMTRQAVSKHLAILEEANLVVTVWRGREKLHYLNPVPIHDIASAGSGNSSAARLQALGDLKKGWKLVMRDR